MNARQRGGADASAPGERDVAAGQLAQARRQSVVQVETEGKTVEAWAYTYTHASHAIR